MMVGMDIYHVMRTTGAVRVFTGEPLPDETLTRILDNARFAPSGGNRQGTRVVVVRDPAAKERSPHSPTPAFGAISPSNATGRTRGTRYTPWE